uniref:Raftlin family member 2 n=1 Tax=Ovis aries TaxID=9940 RepID=A0AC11EPL9_SHEEP
MGCGLRKLEDPDDSSPGKIYSTLKRPQVETKTEFAYEYVLLDFTLQGHLGSIPWLERSPGEGNGNPQQYSCLENPMEQRNLEGYGPWGFKELDTA